MLTYTSKIIIGRKPAIEKKLIAMQRKAKRMGIPPISFSFAACNSPVYVYEDNEGTRYSSEEVPKSDNMHLYTGIMLERCEIVVTGEAPVFDGWRFVAKLSPTVDRKANLLLTIPGYTDTQLLPYIDKVGLCEHCQTTRYRKETFVVQHADGTIKVVGRQCLAAFIGGTSPEAIAKWGEFLFEIPAAISDSGDDMDYYAGSRCILSVDIIQLLTASVSIIDKYGWCSRSEANDYSRQATADIVWAYFFDRKFPKEEVEINDTHRTVAEGVLDWMKLCEGNEYMQNLRTLSTQECVAHNGLGLAVSAVQAYRRMSAERATVTHIDEFYGVVGSRNVATVVLLRLNQIDTYYGTSCIHTFQTKTGEKLTWFASSGGNWFTNSDIGLEFDIDFRVKKHEMYRGTKQTIVSHVKCIREEESCHT